MSKQHDPRVIKLRAWLDQYLNREHYRLDPVSGDASFRRYFRVTTENQHIIAVDAPPEKENSEPFVRLNNTLAKHNIRVPELLAYEPHLGFMLLTDFGDQLLLDSLNADNADALYRSAIHCLLDIQNISDDTIPSYNSTLLRNEMSLFTDWFLDQHLKLDTHGKAAEILDQVFDLLTKNALEQPQVFVHRDYHSRNIMLLENDELGIIDYQDAVLGPITYDLVSLLRDCYIDWPETQITHWLELFFNAKQANGHLGDIEQSTFIRWFDLMGVQRHMKAIGIFCRLHYRDHKPTYLQDIPRTLNYLVNVTQKYAELAPFYSYLETHVLPNHSS